jgi:hypothetical protein
MVRSRRFRRSFGVIAVGACTLKRPSASLICTTRSSALGVIVKGGAYSAGMDSIAPVAVWLQSATSSGGPPVVPDMMRSRFL